MHSYCIFLFLIWFGFVPRSSLQSQPRIRVINGHMTLIGANDKNIMFATSGGGGVYVNGQDLVQLATLAKNVTKALERSQGNIADPLDMNGLNSTDVIRRIIQIESVLTNLPNMALNRRMINRVNRRITFLQRKVTSLKNLLVQNECASNPCLNGGTCQDLFNAFICFCPKQWEGSLCERDVNECTRFEGTDLGCQNSATCVNKQGGYECLCATGWFGIHCTRRSTDCNTGGAEICGHGTCITQSTSVGYKCICDQGWTTDGKTPVCTTDVDECTLSKPPCSINPPVQCINVPGSFYCGNCPPGYSGNGYYCVDIDECSIFNGGCSMIPMVQCINTLGSRTCGQCPPGYLGNGVVCSYQGICGVNNGGCYSAAQCRENPRISSTYVECICPPGYTGNGIGPTGCSLTTSANPCLSNPCSFGNCSVNIITGDYICNCRSRYTGRNCDIKKDPCASNPCLNGGSCFNVLFISYRCECTTGYTGINCRDERQECGGRLKGYEGVLQYPSTGSTRYGHRVSCAWTIETNASKTLNILFTKFHLEQSAECQYDWLQIHDGRYSASHMIGRFCGTTLPNGGIINTTTNVIYLWFRSDVSISKTGFALNWTTIDPVCDKYIDVVSHGTIKSPGSPGNYPSNRDCYWTLDANYDKRIEFHFFSLMIGTNDNCSRDYLEFYTDKAEGIPFAQYCNTSHPEPLISPSSKVVIHFHSDASGTYPGFQISYTPVSGIPGCSGLYTKDSGIIHIGDITINGPIICEYKIHLPKTLRIKIQFISFDVGTNSRCTNHFVSIYEGLTVDSPLIGKYCGNILPPSYVSLGNKLLILYKPLTGHGFKLKYTSVCGGQYTASSGVIQSINYPSFESNTINCIYEIAQPLGTIITLNVIDITMQVSCFGSYLEIRDGDNENSTLIGKFCRKLPNAIVSTHNYLWLNFNRGFDTRRKYYLNYTTTDIGCGGILKTNIGTIQSPAHPDGYPSETDCTWVIIAPVDHVVQLTWMTFNIESSYNCIYDYVAVYDNNTEHDMGGSMGKYCGTKSPPVLLTTSNIMTIKFKTDTTVSNDGFLASYTFVFPDRICGGTYFVNSGIIRSPYYPKSYPTNRDCVWTITVKTGQQIMLNIEDFQLESYTNCRYDFLEIRNGGTAASPLIGKYCGNDIPKQIPSHANQLYLHFKSDMTKNDKGFKIIWQSTATGCGGTLTSPKGSIISPNYPQSYGRTTECYWKISLNAGSVIQIIFADIDLEPHITCHFDYVEIFDGGDFSANSLGRFCSSAHPPFIRSTKNQVLIKFRSDISFQGRGFQLQYTSVCQNTVTGYNGVIESPNFPNGYPHGQDCLWDIGVTHGNKVNITFSHFELERSLINNNCTYDYVEVKYYDEDNEEMITHGRYCGYNNPPHMSFNSNHTQIHFVTDNLFVGSGFRLEWHIDGCGGILTHPEGSISTPNYPHAYPRSTRCEWVIEVEYGSSVQITFENLDLETISECTYDFIEVYNGRNNTYSLLNKLCHTDKPTIITSSGHVMFVVFESDFSYQGRGFQANYTTVPTKCGGKLTAVSGYFNSPNYPKNFNALDNCEWLIEIQENHIIDLEFIDVDLPNLCDNYYITIYDGTTSDYPMLEKICGSNLPNSTIKSTYNHLFVQMRTQYVTSKGFRAKYTTACGAVLSEKSGIIDYKMKTSLMTDIQTCHWSISAEDVSQHVSLTVTYLEGTYCSYSTENSFSVFNGFTSGPLIGNYCDRLPPTIVSEGSALEIKSSIGFSASYVTFGTACGGIIFGESGRFASPGYPNNYPFDIECEWVLNVSLSNSISLAFDTFDLLESENCNEDFLEIRDTNSMGKLLGLFCGKNTPTNIKNIGSIWIFFKSIKPEGNISIPSGKGFYAQYNLDSETVLNGPSGKIYSPLYPELYQKLGLYSWRIIVKVGYSISIKINDLDMEHGEDNYCFYAYLTLYDGYDNNAPEIDTLCGSVIKGPFKSTHNVMYITAAFDINKHGARFALEWLEVENVIESSTEMPVEGCGSSEVIDINTVKNFTISSPGYPNGYAQNLNCEWIFSTVPENHLTINFLSVNLENFYGNCLTDLVKIFNGKDGTQEWELVATACLSNDTLHIISASNLMKVVFISDSYVNQTGFQAIVQQACGGSIQKPSGIIHVDDTTFSRKNSLECQWNITVRPGRTIELKFRNFDLGSNKDQKCNNYILLKNGQYADSPILGDGKYCGTSQPDILKTTANHVYIKFISVSKVPGFILEFEEAHVKCGGAISLTNINNSTIISSPNYPNIPLPHTQCIWQIMAPPGEALRIDFLDRFDLTESSDCTLEYVEIRNGGTEKSPLINRWCSDTPSTQVTLDNMMFIKFFTDVNDPKNGFRAVVSISTCGGIIRGETGQISSPLFYSGKKSYPKNMECTWQIFGREDHYLILTFKTLDISSLTLCSSSYVDIIEESSIDSNQKSLGKFCNGDPNPIKTSSNKVIIRYVTVNSKIQRAGFLLKFNTSQEECGGTLETETGYINSPGYPYMNHLRRNCEWTIKVPKGRRIKVEVLDLDLDKTIDQYEQGLAFFNGEDFKSHITYLKADDSRQYINSSDNKMSIYFWSSYPSSHRGFKLKYTSNEPSLCVGDFNSDSGKIVSPLGASSYYCSWERNDIPPANKTLVIIVNALFNSTGSQGASCRYASNGFTVTVTREKTELVEFCTTTKKPKVIRSPYLFTTLIAVQTKFRGTLNFTATYSTYPCGGIVTNSDGYIASPNFPTKFSQTLECSWIIKLPEQQTIQVNFASMDLGDDCDKSFIVIHNGLLPTDPRIGKFCGSNSPQKILSQSNGLWIEYHADVNGNGKGFNLTYEPVITGCGGIFHDNSRIIQTPNYPASYPNNAECEWEIHAQNGYHIGLEFIGRFQLENSNNCENDFVEVFDNVNTEWKHLGKICGRDNPPFFNSTSNKMKIRFRSNGRTVGSGFKAKWVLNCGGKFIADENEKYITSPGYPNDYKNLINCVYDITTPETHINIVFEDFDLETGPADCLYDNVTITSALMYYPIKTSIHCGNRKPSPIKLYGTATIQFRTDSWVTRRGFKFKYYAALCGGVFTKPTVITSPNDNFHTDSLLAFGGKTCYYNITAPANEVVAIRFESFFTTHSYNCQQTYVEIYNGLTPDIENRLVSLCGNISYNLPPIKSNGTTMLIKYKDSYYSHEKNQFRAAVYFMYGPTAGCGGIIDLDKIQNKTINGPINLSNADCHWQIRANDGYVILINLLESDECTIQNCSRFEIRDGGGQFSELIAKISNWTKSTTYTTSGTQGWIRWETFSTYRKAFRLQVSAIATKCGKSLLYATNTTQHIISPNYPTTYPDNIKCIWKIKTALSSDKVELKFYHFDLGLVEDTATNCDNDRVEIMDSSTSKVIQEGLGSGTIFSSVGTIPIYMASRSPIGVHQYCGQKAKEFEYYSGTNEIIVSFYSGNANHGTGFKLEYKTIGCDRNYTSPQGRILNNNVINTCIMTITAPENTTISMYFMTFYLAGISNDCDRMKFQVYDGATNNAPVLATLCGYSLPNPIFTTQNKMYIMVENLDNGYANFDVLYTSTTKGQGCGGEIYTYRGKITSPMYPNSYNNISECTWDIRVPMGLDSAIKFSVFDVVSSCDTDYIIITTYLNGEANEHVYCGLSKPPILHSSNRLKIVYKTSYNNRGTGWVAQFTSMTDGYTLHW